MVKPHKGMRLTLAFLPAIALISASLGVNAAAIYTYKGPNGEVIYSDQPPPGTSTTTTNTSTATSTSTTTSTTKPSSTSTSSAKPNIIQKGQMPAVDISKNMLPKTGYSTLLIKTTGEMPTAGQGDFRIKCPASHMGNDDPISFPNQPGASSHNTFYGNVAVNAKTNFDTLASTGNSTCMGGIANRSAYWTSSVIDTKTNAPIVPEGTLWYYKSGNTITDRSTIKPPPKGMRMIAGNILAKSEAEAKNIGFVCYYQGKAINWVNGSVQPKIAGVDPKYIPACPQGGDVVAWVSFPQCWDGKNLDSADHISHMSYQYTYDKVTKKTSCPATHPYAIPKIRLNMHYRVMTPDGTKFWRVASDNYQPNGQNAGYSMHAGWVNGWDEKIIGGITKNCVSQMLNCGGHMLGDKRVIYWP